MTDINDGLTAEEIAALQEDDGGDATTTDETTTDEGVNADTTNEDPSSADDGTAAAADDGAAAAAEPEPTAAAEPAAEPSAEASAPAQQAPILVVEAPADADAKLAKITEDKAALLTQFDDGDITTKEYQAQLDALNKQEREIERAVDRATLAAEMEQQRQRNEWERDVNAFLAANTQYKDNPRLYRALDQEVRDVANSEEAKSMTGAQIIAKAHANLAEAFGFQAPAAAKAAPKQAIPKPGVVPSLHNVPSAQVEDTSGGKFAALSRLDGVALEEALAKMSQAERDQYLASA